MVDQVADGDPLVLKKKLEVDQAQAKITQASHAYNPGQGPLPKYEAELEEIKKDLEKVKSERRAAAAALVADRRALIRP